MDSTKLLAEPMIANTHIQKMAPGPPATMAMATLAMLPTPTRVPSPMQNASNEETDSLQSPSRTPESESLEVSPILRICRPRSLNVKYSPAPMRSTNATYQMYMFSVPRTSLKVSVNAIVSQRVAESPIV